MLYLFGLRGAHLLATGNPIYIQASVLAALMGFGMLFYFVLVHISGAQPLGLLLRRLRRRG
jgi:putative peptidoglycan lipid II flippase